MSSPSPSVVLSIAGFDPSSGAGITADLLTIQNLSCFGISALTSIVAQTPHTVSSQTPISSEILADQCQLLLESYPVSAIKIGLVATHEQAKLLGDLLANTSQPIVLDPVGLSSTGHRLQELNTIPALLDKVGTPRTLLTPNRLEALALLHNSVDTSLSAAELAELVSKQYSCSVLLTGGHEPSNEKQMTDTLYTKSSAVTFQAKTLQSSASLHGTGCVLSSAIACGLARKLPLFDAITSARTYLRQAFAAHYEFPPLQPQIPPLLALNHHKKSSHDQ